MTKRPIGRGVLAVAFAYLALVFCGWQAVGWPLLFAAVAPLVLLILLAVSAAVLFIVAAGVAQVGDNPLGNNMDETWR